MISEMFKLDLEKAEEPDIKLPTYARSLKSKRVPKNIYFCFIDYANSFDYVDHNKLKKLLKRCEPDHLICLLRNLYPGQEAVRIVGETPNWFRRKGVCLGCILLFYLLNLHAEYIIQNAGQDEAEAGIKTAERNTNNFRYTDYTTLVAESKEELKSLLMKVKKDSEKAGLIFSI